MDLPELPKIVGYANVIAAGDRVHEIDFAGNDRDLADATVIRVVHNAVLGVEIIRDGATRSTIVDAFDLRFLA